MTYEKMKNWMFERKRRRIAKLGREWTTDDDKLVRPKGLGTLDFVLYLNP